MSVCEQALVGLVRHLRVSLDARKHVELRTISGDW
jgi:hypothetical protein